METKLIYKEYLNNKKQKKDFDFTIIILFLITVMFIRFIFSFL